MSSLKKQVKKKTKKPLARMQKCNGGSTSSSAKHISKATKTKKPKNSYPESILLDDASATDKKAERNVQGEELEEALIKTRRRWATIMEKFYEKHEQVRENSNECSGTGHHNYKSLGQAKLKKKKKAQKNKECSEKTMEEIVKVTRQFTKKCSMKGDPIVSSKTVKSPTSSVEKDKSGTMGKVPSPSKSPKANRRTSNGTTSSPSSPSKKAVAKPNSSNLQKSHKALKPTSVRTVSNDSKRPGDKMSEEQSSATFSDKSDSTANLALVSVQDQNSTKGKSRSKPLSLKNRTVLKLQKRQSVKIYKTIIYSEEKAELDSESVIDESSLNDDLNSFYPASNKIQGVSIDELPFKNGSLKNQTLQKIKELPIEKNSRPSTSTFCDNHGMEKLSSGSVEMTASDPLSDFTSTSVENSSKVRSSAVKKRKYKRSKDRIASESVEMTASDHLLDSTAVKSGFKETPSSSALKKQKGKDSIIKSLPFKRTNRLSNPSHNSSLQTPKRDNSSVAKFLSFRDKGNMDILTSPNPNISPGRTMSFRKRIKVLHPEKNSRPSPSSFCDKHDKDQLSSGSAEMTEPDPLSDFTSTSVGNSSKLSSSATKKRKCKPSEDQIAHEGVDMTASDHLLDSTPIGLDFKGSPSALKKQKCSNLRNESLPLMRTIRLSYSISSVPSFRKRSHHHSHKSPIYYTVPVDVLVRPPPELDL